MMQVILDGAELDVDKFDADTSQAPVDIGILAGAWEYIIFVESVDVDQVALVTGEVAAQQTSIPVSGK